MKAKTIFWAVYHMVIIAMMFFWLLKSRTADVCFYGFLLLYTQQWWIAEERK